MTPPLRIGVMQLTMEPLGEIIEHARALDRHGFDTIWLAEAYPWWRKHQMEARSSTVLSALIARETERLTIGWGIISPFTRHPIQVAMDARVTQELAPDRFNLGFGASRIFMKEIGADDVKPLNPTRDAVRIVRGVLEGGEFSYEGKAFSATVPALCEEAQAPHGSVPIYVAGTGPRMQRYAGEEADGLLTPSITTPGFVRYSRENLREGAESLSQFALGLGTVPVFRRRAGKQFPADSFELSFHFRVVGEVQFLELLDEPDEPIQRLLVDAVGLAVAFAVGLAGLRVVAGGGAGGRGRGGERGGEQRGRERRRLPPPAPAPRRPRPRA